VIDTVLFDLDGTLSDSSSGIIGSLRLAFDEVGVPRLTPEQEWSLLGPPFNIGLPPFIGEDVTPAVVAAYRRHYAQGMYDTKKYEGIDELLDGLREAGIRLAVATSKPEPSANPIVAHLGLTEYFETIGGDDLTYGRGTKALVVGEVLDRLGHPDPATVLMIGDRSHDVLGAAVHGIATHGAGWGYGAPGELAAAGAVAVHAHPMDLGTALRPVISRAPAS
jgi:phosphoglycolate phosphatase